MAIYRFRILEALLDRKVGSKLNKKDVESFHDPVLERP